MARLGVDFGTTNTVVVCSDRGRYPVVPHVVQTAIGRVVNEVFPSLVAFEHDTGGFVYGADAERALARPGAEKRYSAIRVAQAVAAQSHRRGALRFRRASGRLRNGKSPARIRRSAARIRGAVGSFQCGRAPGGGADLACERERGAAIRYARVFQGGRFRCDRNARRAHGGCSRVCRPDSARQSHGSAKGVRVGGDFRFGRRYLRLLAGENHAREFTVIDTAGIDKLGGDDLDRVLADMFARQLKTDVDALSRLQRERLLRRACQQKESISSGSVRSLMLVPSDIGLKGGACIVAVPEYCNCATPGCTRCRRARDAIERCGGVCGGS